MSEINNEADLNENFEEVMSDAEVITVPIDDTLSNSGEAADAAAVGAALALKADISQVATISVNGQLADEQGVIIVTSDEIEISDSDSTTVKNAIEAKADLVASATNGNFAGLDASGNLTDSGSKASDFKLIQAAVEDPASSGYGVEFISGISQSASGVITPSKKTVRSMSGATSSAPGTSGLVPAPSAGDDAKYLKGDGSWGAISIPEPQDMTGATVSEAGTHGLVPAPAAGDQNKVLTGGGTWSNQPALNAQAIGIVQDGLAIIVDGDTCTTAVPVGGYAYVKNNTHSLTEGLYRNTSAAAFPTSGGTADSTVFTAVSVGGVNDLLDRLTWKVHTFDTPVGTDTLNSRTSATVAELANATEVIICVTVSSSGSRNQIPFVKYGSIATYGEYRYIRPNSADNAYSYDVQWIPASNEVNIRFDYKGSSASTPKIYEVLYR